MDIAKPTNVAGVRYMLPKISDRNNDARESVDMWLEPTGLSSLSKCQRHAVLGRVVGLGDPSENICLVSPRAGQQFIPSLTSDFSSIIRDPSRGRINGGSRIPTGLL